MMQILQKNEWLAGCGLNIYIYIRDADFAIIYMITSSKIGSSQVGASSQFWFMSNILLGDAQNATLLFHLFNKKL